MTCIFSDNRFKARPSRDAEQPRETNHQDRRQRSQEEPPPVNGRQTQDCKQGLKQKQNG